MQYSKFVAPILAGALSLTLGLVGCGGNNAASTSMSTTEETSSAPAETDTTTTTDTTATSADVEEDKVVYWQGETDEGDTILYSEDDADKTTTILVFGEHDESGEILGYSGQAKTEGDEVTISDTESGTEFTFTLTDKTAESMTVDLGEHGKGTLNAVTQKEFEKEVDEMVNAAKEIGEALESLDEQDIEDLVNLLDAVAQEVDSAESADSANSTTK